MFGTSKRPALAVGNYCNGIIVGNIDGAFLVAKNRGSSQTVVTGPLADKCVQVAPRLAHCLRDQKDAVLLYEDPPENFLDYCEGLWGFRPHHFAPARIPYDKGGSLSLLAGVLEDEELIARLSAESLQIHPFIQHPLVHELGERTRMQVAGASARAVRGGLIVHMNDKGVFQHTAVSLGMPLPKSQHVFGLEGLVPAAKRLYEEHGRVMLRLTRSAGGLGSIMVTSEDVEKSGLGFEAYLDSVLVPRHNWEHGFALVEKVVPLVAVPTVRAIISEGEVTEWFVSDQVMHGTSCTGIRFPSVLNGNLLGPCMAHCQRYVHGIINLGYTDGSISLDVGIVAEEGLAEYGPLVFFEPNARFGSANHPRVIGKKKKPDNGDPHIHSDDCLVVPAGSTLEGFLGHLDACQADWKDSRGDGVVVTIPPDKKNSMVGFTALADTAERLDELVRATHSFSCPN